MGNQVLDVQQMQHLQELGLELNKQAMLSWIVDERGKDKPLLCTSSDAVDFSHYCLPAYTLQDVLEHLPVKLGVTGKIHITRDFLTSAWTVEYFEGATLGRVSFDNEELIDAAYDMLCLLVEKGYVKNKA